MEYVIKSMKEFHMEFFLTNERHLDYLLLIGTNNYCLIYSNFVLKVILFENYPVIFDLNLLGEYNISFIGD